MDYQKRAAFIAHRSLGNMIQRTSISRAVLRSAGKVMQLQAVAGSEPSADTLGNMDSVVTNRQSIQGNGYLSDFIRKNCR